MAEFIVNEFPVEEFLIAADLLESNSLHDPAKCLRDAALFKSDTGSVFEVETNLPSLLVEAARIYAEQITLAKFTKVVFSVLRDHATRSFSFTLLAGSYWTKELIDSRDVVNIELGGIDRSGIVDRFLRIIEGFKLQERLLELAGGQNE